MLLHFHPSGPPAKSITPHRLLQGCSCNWCRTRGITSINHIVEDRLFSPAALLWCAVTVSIADQSPATPKPLIAKSLIAGARYGWWSLQTNRAEWGGLQSLLVPTNSELCSTLSHSNHFEKRIQRDRRQTLREEMGLSCCLSFTCFSLLSTHIC